MYAHLVATLSIMALLGGQGGSVQQRLQDMQIKHILALFHAKAAKYTQQVEVARRELDLVVADLNREIQASHTVMEEIKGGAAAITSYFDTWIQGLQKRARSIERTPGPVEIKQVAFQAFFTPRDVEQSEDKQWTACSEICENIVFPECSVNTMDVYDKDNGHFMVPKDGIYLIATRISTASRKGAAVFEIRRQSSHTEVFDEVIARAETLSMRQDPDAVMATAIVQLYRTDIIMVTSGVSGASRVYLGSESWFMGVLLQTRVHVPRMMLRSLGFGPLF